MECEYILGGNYAVGFVGDRIIVDQLRAQIAVRVWSMEPTWLLSDPHYLSGTDFVVLEGDKKLSTMVSLDSALVRALTHEEFCKVEESFPVWSA